MKPIDRLINRADQILIGHGEITEDWRDALEIYTSAADMDSGKANYRLGTMYWDGSHVKHNPEKSIQYFKKSTKLGYIPAAGSLAHCYFYTGDKILAERMWTYYFNNLTPEFYDDSHIMAARFSIYSYSEGINLKIHSIFLEKSTECLNLLQEIRSYELDPLIEAIEKDMQRLKTGELTKSAIKVLDEKAKFCDQRINWWNGMFDYLATAVEQYVSAKHESRDLLQ